jgi:Globin
MFKFGAETDNDLKTNPLFVLHAKALMEMISAAVDLLDPHDTDPLKEVLVQLGNRHIKYGVTKEYFPEVMAAGKYYVEMTIDDHVMD